MGGAATALGYLGLKPGAELLAAEIDETVRFPFAATDTLMGISSRRLPSIME
jgi:hypothetical protein